MVRRTRRDGWLRRRSRRLVIPLLLGLSIASAASPAMAAAPPLAAAPAPAPAPTARATDGQIRIIHGASGYGPARYDRVFVRTYGPASADRVLVLVPGLGSGAGSFRLIAPELVRRVPDLQVWTVDARTQAFEDPRGFESGNADLAAAYYAGTAAIDGHTFTPVDGAQVLFVRRWGLALLLEDLRRVVLTARAEGHRVILGGHSNGAATALAYATWDFDGHPGYRDLTALVVIDGGLMGTNPGNAISLEQARQRLAELAAGDPFFAPAGPGLPPWLSGVLNGSYGILADTRPDDPAPPQLQALLGSADPGFPLTNEALLGMVFTVTHTAVCGQLADSGSPRGWVSRGAISPVRRLAEVLNGQRPNSDEWYTPARRVLDISGADALQRNDVSDLLGLRTWHRAEVDVALYAFATQRAPDGPLDSGVLYGARQFLHGSRIRDAVLRSDEQMLHFDPLYARPDRNSFLTTVVPFLQRR